MAKCYDCGGEIDGLDNGVMETRQVSGPSHNDVGTFSGDFQKRGVHADRRLCAQVKERKAKEEKLQYAADKFKRAVKALETATRELDEARQDLGVGESLKTLTGVR